MRVGYARVSKKDQRLEPQRDALLADGCERVFEEKVSSRESDRRAMLAAFDYCRKGDVFVVARLDRPGRRLIFHVFGALAEFEREIIRERTMAELESARARGRHGERPRALDEVRAVAGGHSEVSRNSPGGVGSTLLTLMFWQ